MIEGGRSEASFSLQGLLQVLNILAYVRAKFKEAALAGIQDALDEIDPLSSRRGPEDGDGPAAGAATVLPNPPAPPALGAAKQVSGDGAVEQERSKPALQDQIEQAVAAAAANANPNAVTPASGPSAARREKRPRGENGP